MRQETDATRWALFFDSDCARCSKVARTVRRHSRRVEVVGLRNSEARSDFGLPPVDDMAWEPVLVRLTGDESQIYRGAHMSIQLAQLLGARGALATVRALADMPSSDSGAVSRRTVLARGALLGVSA